MPRVCRVPCEALGRGVRRHPHLDRAAGRPGHEQREQVLGEQPQVVAVGGTGAEPVEGGPDEGGVGGAETDGHEPIIRPALSHRRGTGVSFTSNPTDPC